MKIVLMPVDLPEKEEKCWKCRFLDIDYHCVLFNKTIRSGFGVDTTYNRLKECLEKVKEN